MDSPSALAGVDRRPTERTLTYAAALNEALREEMERDPSVFCIGEDIAVWGGGGGLYGVTSGLVEEFGPERVRDTPVSEEGIAGLGVGAALVGLRPVAEIMYSDFLTLAMDPIVNQAAKMRYMFGGQASVPHGHPHQQRRARAARPPSTPSRSRPGSCTSRG